MEPGARPATLYDGQVARARPVHLRLANGMVHIHTDTGEAEPIPIEDLKALPDRRQAAFQHTQRDGWRLIFDEPLPDAWASQMPAHETWRTHLDRIGLGPALAMGAAAVALLVLFWDRFIDLMKTMVAMVALLVLFCVEYIHLVLAVGGAAVKVLVQLWDRFIDLMKTMVAMVALLAVVWPPTFAELGDQMVAQLEQGDKRYTEATGQRALDALRQGEGLADAFDIGAI